MDISVENLIIIIERNTKSMKVHTPSDDYYARSGDHSEDTIEYLDPKGMITDLEELRDYGDPEWASSY